MRVAEKLDWKGLIKAAAPLKQTHSHNDPQYTIDIQRTLRENKSYNAKNKLWELRQCIFAVITYWY
jgi:hypothetical protein